MASGQAQEAACLLPTTPNFCSPQPSALAYRIPAGRPDVELEVTFLLVPDEREEFHQPFLPRFCPCAGSQQQEAALRNSKGRNYSPSSRREQLIDCNSVSEQGK